MPLWQYHNGAGAGGEVRQHKVLRMPQARSRRNTHTQSRREGAEGEVQSRRLSFKAVRCIFGLSETVGQDLPPAEVPGWDLQQALDQLDVKQVPFRELDGNIQGYSVDREFAINPVAVHPVKTTFHELGHIVLGHTAGSAAAEYRSHRGIKEFQAESVAYLAMNELELMTPEQASSSRGYIQGWLQRQTPAEADIRPVFMATDKILRAGRSNVIDLYPNGTPTDQWDPAAESF